MFDLSLLFFVFFALLQLLIADPLVQLPNGRILGRQDITSQDKSYYAFEKVPYAAPPVGPLRFKAPQPVENWEGALNTTHMDVVCMQLDATTHFPADEDCLYLNIFTPQLPGDSNVTLPVMLFIHGGAFVSGTNTEFHPDWFVNNDVILVAINYRLSIFGFLSTQDEVIPGNYGLKDQQLAIKWTHDNIHLFGGDPEMITIFGQSAGSASIAYQLLNQNSRGLFRGAILESGSCLSGWAYQRLSRDIAFDLASMYDPVFYTSDNSTALLELFQSLDQIALRALSQYYYVTLFRQYDYDINIGSLFAPVVEVKNPEAFLTRKMYQLLAAGNAVPVPIIIGINAEESLDFNTDLEVLKHSMEVLDEHLEWLVPEDMQIIDQANLTRIGTKIRDMYTDGEPLVDHLGDGVRMATDTGFSRPIIRHAELFSKVANTYFYQFSYAGKLSGNNPHYEGAETVIHGAELHYLFCSGRDCDLESYPEADRKVQERLLKLWINFAKYQNPTPEPSELLQNVTWPEVDTDEGDFLYLDINENLEVKNHPKKDTYKRWIELYDSLGRTDFDTY